YLPEGSAARATVFTAAAPSISDMGETSGSFVRGVAIGRPVAPVKLDTVVLPVLALVAERKLLGAAPFSRLSIPCPFLFPDFAASLSRSRFQSSAPSTSFLTSSSRILAWFPFDVLGTFTLPFASTTASAPRNGFTLRYP